MNNNNLNLDLQEIILILIIFYSLYLLLCKNKSNQENFTQTDNSDKLANNVKILSDFVNFINEKGKLELNTNDDIIFNNKIIIDNLNGYSDKSLVFKNNENILNKNVEYIPIGTIISFSGNLNDIPKNWAICDGYYYMLSKYRLVNKNLIDNKEDDKILKNYKYPNFDMGIPHLDFIPLNKRNIFFKTPNLIGRTVYGSDINDNNLGKNNGEVGRYIKLDQIKHNHKVLKIQEKGDKSSQILNLPNAITSDQLGYASAKGYRIHIERNKNEASTGITFKNEYNNTKVNLPPRDVVDKDYNYTDDDIIGNSEIFNFQKKLKTLPKSVGLYWIIKI